MTSQVQPFRLLGSQEIALIEKNLAQIINDWNEKAACLSLHLQLNCTKKQSIPVNVVLLSQQNSVIALLEQHCFSSFQNCLFNDDSPCFAPVSLTLFNQFLSELLGLDSTRISRENWQENDWFYPGSPALILTLSTIKEAFNIYLHPQWVLSKLPKTARKLKPLKPLDNALAPQDLMLEVHLQAFQLPLNHLLHLQVGDVIKLDHRLDQPLQLQHQQQTLSQVQAGQHNSFKSVKLVRST